MDLASLSVDTDAVSKLLETLTAELERPRELSARVLNYIGGNYGIDHDAIGQFLVTELPKLEDDELDLILSPAFTPKLADQAIFAELLGTGSIPRAEWPNLVQQLIARPVRAQLVTPGGVTYPVPLREVTIDRYVHRLRLEGTIPQTLFSLLARTPLVGDGPLLKAVARRAIWENGSRCNILVRYLTAAPRHGSYRIEDALELLSQVESHKPADVADLLARIPRRQQALREEINNPKRFFSGAAEQLHGGERDHRQHGDARMSAKEDELAFLGRLQQVLTIPDVDMGQD